MVYILGERKGKEMRIPKEKTIRGKINGYAYKAGFTIVRNADNTYNIFDIYMGYYTNKNVTMDTVVRVVIDTLYAMEYRKTVTA
jgi:hypothetical protein